jgi:hypothetical protein
MPPSEIIWNRLIQFEGEVFQSVRNIEFTYQIQGEIFIRNGVNRNIPKRDFQFVYDNIDLYNGPGSIPSIINGRSYIWAVLKDIRIANNLQ